MMQGYELGLCLGSSWGESMPESHKNFHINRAVTWLGLVNRVKGQLSERNTSSIQHVMFQKCFLFPHTILGSAFDGFFFSFANVIQCLLTNYFTEWWILLYYTQSRPWAQLRSKPDLSSEASSLLTPSINICFFCWILNVLTLYSSDIKVPHLSLIPLVA